MMVLLRGSGFRLEDVFEDELELVFGFGRPTIDHRMHVVASRRIAG